MVGMLHRPGRQVPERYIEERDSGSSMAQRHEVQREGAF